MQKVLSHSVGLRKRWEWGGEGKGGEGEVERGEVTWGER